MDGAIDRIKNANFSHSVRGYDRHEVDGFLRELADWLERGGDEETGSEAVRTRLERVGEQTSGILGEAHEAAEAIREDASREARQQLVEANATSEKVRAQADEYRDGVHAQADAYASKMRTEADEYAERVRSEADTAVSEAKQAAQGEAEGIIAEANRRREAIESNISDLEQRREAVVAELERLASGIAGTATQHRGPRHDAAEGAESGQAADEPAPAPGPEQRARAAAVETEETIVEAPDEAETREQSAVPRSE